MGSKVKFSKSGYEIHLIDSGVAGSEKGILGFEMLCWLTLQPGPYMLFLFVGS